MYKHSFDMQPTLEGVEKVQEEMRPVLEASGLRRRHVSELLLAAGECLEHIVLESAGVAGDPAAPGPQLGIHLHLLVDGATVRIRIRDNGPGHGWLADPDGGSAGSRPLDGHLVRNLMSEVTHERAAGWNVTTLTRHLPGFT